MILTDYFYPEPDITWDYAVQCGVRHGVIRLPERDDFDLTDGSAWRALCGRFRSRGIRPLVVEPLPNCLHDHIKTGDRKRDESIDRFIRMLPLMKEQGITTVCFNFMAHVGWTRTRSDYPERGGALSTAFRLVDYKPVPARITARELWDNYAYFVKAAVQEAEKHGVSLALHPDDPPLPALGGVERIMISLENILKAVDTVRSEYLGVTFCQACFRAMGEDPEKCAAALKDRIRFIHFRNIEGTAADFHETFHDNGSIDMARMIALYRDLGLDVPIRVDHVPLMGNGETGGPDRPAGYSAVGRLYAIGYLRGLLESAGCALR